MFRKINSREKKIKNISYLKALKSDFRTTRLSHSIKTFLNDV
jgi:hypothetical protein